jgi:hypothetical protein
MKKRGVIFCPHFEINDDGAYIPSVQIRPHQLRFFCLYWDHIVQPVSAQLPQWKKSLDEIVLEEVGILIKLHDNISVTAESAQSKTSNLFVNENAYSLKVESDKNWIEHFIKNQNDAAIHLKKNRSDVLWTPQQSYRNFISDPQTSRDVDCLHIQLHNVLPVPSSNISLKKIVKFKYENSSLFSEFKSLMDILTHNTSKAGEISDYSVKLAHDDLEVCIKEIRIKTAEKFGRDIFRTNMSVNIDISGENILESLKNGAAGALVSTDVQSALTQFTIASLSSLLKFETRISPRLLVIPDEQKHISYLTEGFKNKILV